MDRLRFIGHCHKYLYNQHRISIAEEAVLVLDRFFIGFHSQIITCKSAYHDQQARLWQMEICYERIGDIKLVRRMDKGIGPAFRGL